MPLTLVVLHRNRAYARDIGERLAAAAGDSLVVRHAENVDEALSLLRRANRLLFDADDDFFDVLAHATEVRSYALTTKLDASLASKLLKYGAIAVGTCTTNADIAALATTIVAGVVAAPRPTHVLEYLATPGRYARERAEEDERILETTLELTHHNVTETARLLGLPRTTVQSQMKKAQLPRRRE